MAGDVLDWRYRMAWRSLPGHSLRGLAAIGAAIFLASASYARRLTWERLSLDGPCTLMAGQARWPLKPRDLPLGGAKNWDSPSFWSTGGGAATRPAQRWEMPPARAHAGGAAIRLWMTSPRL